MECGLLARIRIWVGRSEMRRRFLTLASWTMIAFALDKMAMLVIVFLMARILGAADYGRLTLSQGLVNAAQIFVVLGAGTMLARYLPALREEGVQRAVEVINLCAMVVLGTAAIFTIGGLIGAPRIATGVLDLTASSLVPYLMIGWVLLTAVNSLMLTIMLSFEKGRAIGAVSLIGALVSIALVPLLTFRLGLAGAVAALVAAEIVKAALLLTLYSRLLATDGVPVLTPARCADIPLLWRFGLPVFLNSALWGPTLWLAQFIVKTRAPDGLTAVGVFGFANNLLGAIILISSLTNRAALPIQSSLHARGAHAELRHLSWSMTAVQAGVATAIAIPITLMAPLIMDSAGSDFGRYWPVLIIMIASAVVIAGQTALGNYLLVNDRPYFIVATLAPWAFIILGAAIAFAQHGPYSLAWGLLAASILRSALFYWGWIKFNLAKLPATGA